MNKMKKSKNNIMVKDTTVQYSTVHFSADTMETQSKR